MLPRRNYPPLPLFDVVQLPPMLPQPGKHGDNRCQPAAKYKHPPSGRNNIRLLDPVGRPIVKVKDAGREYGRHKSGRKKHHRKIRHRLHGQSIQQARLSYHTSPYGFLLSKQIALELELAFRHTLNVDRHMIVCLDAVHAVIDMVPSNGAMIQVVEFSNDT